MSEMLLINPSPRRGRRKARRTAAQRRATAKLVAMNRARRAAPRRRKAARRRNPAAPAAPVALAMKTTRRRRRNPIKYAGLARVRRRRRNPVGLRGLTSGIMPAITDALVQGGGAVAFDVVHGQIARFLPPMLQRRAGSIGVGDAVKAIGTVMIGRLLNGPTRGLSMRAAKGSLTVQAYEMVRQFVPATMTMGYAGPGMIVPGTSRIGPNRGIVSRYTGGDARSPLLSAYTQPGGVTPLLNRAAPARVREGFIVR